MDKQNRWPQVICLCQTEDQPPGVWGPDKKSVTHQAVSSFGDHFHLKPRMKRVALNGLAAMGSGWVIFKFSMGATVCILWFSWRNPKRVRILVINEQRESQSHSLPLSLSLTPIIYMSYIYVLHAHTQMYIYMFLSLYLAANQPINQPTTSVSINGQAVRRPRSAPRSGALRGGWRPVETRGDVAGSRKCHVFLGFHWGFHDV